MSNLDKIDITKSLIGDTETKKEIFEAIDILIGIIKELRDKVDEDISGIKSELLNKQSRLGSSIDSIETKLEGMRKDTTVSELRKVHDDLARRVAAIPTQKEFPLDPNEIQARFDALEGEVKSVSKREIHDPYNDANIQERLSQIEENVKNLPKNTSRPIFGSGPTRIISVFNNGTKVSDLVTELNIVNATSISNVNKNGRRVTITLPNGGSGTSFETPSGTINSSNVTFTVANTPKAVILNGIWYFENDGYTLSTLTITMLVVPTTGSTLRSVY